MEHNDGIIRVGVDFNKKLHVFKTSNFDESERESLEDKSLSCGLRYKVKKMCALCGTITPGTSIYYTTDGSFENIIATGNVYAPMVFMFLSDTDVTIICKDAQPNLSVFDILSLKDEDNKGKDITKIREEKVERLIKKIKNEISICRNDMKYISSEDENLVLSAYTLLILERYINKSDAFMETYNWGDQPNYTISNEHINIMLNENFEIVHEIVQWFNKQHVDHFYDPRYRAFSTISDEFFQNKLITTLDLAYYQVTGKYQPIR